MRETVRVTLWTAIDTESVSDSGSSFTVLAVTLVLVALGITLMAVTVWFWRLTRPDPEALAPLSVMSDRGFFRRGPIEQRRALDAARPMSVMIEAPIFDGEPSGDVAVESDDEVGIDGFDAADHDLPVDDLPVDDLVDDVAEPAIKPVIDPLL